MREITEQLARLQKEHVDAAINQLDTGIDTKFADSRKFDLVLGDLRYAPKRVAGLALEVLTGQKYGPKSFKGGEESSCFRALRRCGFTVIPKTAPPIRGLTEDLQELLLLQTKYDSKNTPEMKRRGVLVRTCVSGKGA